MKKFFLSLVVALMSVPTFAQYSSGGFSLSESTLYYGLRLGMNISTITGDYIDMNSRVGMNLGAVVGARVSDSTPIFLESGLYFESKGAKDGKYSVGLSYLEIPILIKYGVQVSNDIALLPYIGPYFSYGVGGKYKYESDNIVLKDSSYDYLKHFDMGFKIGCGAEYNKLYAELGYAFGVVNIAKDNPADDAAHNGGFYINVGVNF